MATRAYGTNVVDYTTWQAETFYSVDDLVMPTSPAGVKYKCIAAGTSGLLEPDWNTGIDNGVLWTPSESKVVPPLVLSAVGFGGYSIKDIWVSGAEDDEFLVYGSHDGETWRPLVKLTIGVAGFKHETIQTAYLHIKVDTESVADMTIEIVAGEA